MKPNKINYLRLMTVPIFKIHDYKSEISFMLIIPKDIVFKHATVQYGSNWKPLDHQMGGVSCINYFY